MYYHIKYARLIWNFIHNQPCTSVQLPIRCVYPIMISYSMFALLVQSMTPL